MAVSKRLRHEVLKRDNYTCRYCRSVDSPLTIDHVIPVALGGTDEPTNLVAACRDCNAGKSSVPSDAALVADVTNDALRWAGAMKRAAEIEHGKRTDDIAFVGRFIENVQAILEADPNERTYCVPDLRSPAVGGLEGIRRTVLQFRDNGLDLDDLDRAIRKASANRAISDQHNWKYFCGVAWGIIRDRQEVARQLLEAE
ncbi:MAG: HNH endonuclease [Mycobacterium sp.]